MSATSDDWIRYVIGDNVILLMDNLFCSDKWQNVMRSVAAANNDGIAS